jgi:hypothetical protein
MEWNNNRRSASVYSLASLRSCHMLEIIGEEEETE